VSYAKLATAAALACAAVAVAFELALPYADEAAALGAEDAWPPSLCGAMIGMLQVPSALVLRDSIGSSSAYVALWSACFRCRKSGVADEESTPVFPHFEKAFRRKWWQILFLVAALATSLGLATESQSYGRAAGVPLWASFTGGFVMLLGARLAGGCTSGHGISGMAQLHLQALVATCGMFAGGIGVALLLRALDQDALVAA
jgi:hypothetical protein